MTRSSCIKSHQIMLSLMLSLRVLEYLYRSSRVASIFQTGWCGRWCRYRCWHMAIKGAQFSNQRIMYYKNTSVNKSIKVIKTNQQTALVQTHFEVLTKIFGFWPFWYTGRIFLYTISLIPKHPHVSYLYLWPDQSKWVTLSVSWQDTISQKSKIFRRAKKAFLSWNFHSNRLLFWSRSLFLIAVLKWWLLCW